MEPSQRQAYWRPVDGFDLWPALMQQPSPVAAAAAAAAGGSGSAAAGSQCGQGSRRTCPAPADSPVDAVADAAAAAGGPVAWPRPDVLLAAGRAGHTPAHTSDGAMAGLVDGAGWKLLQRGLGGRAPAGGLPDGWCWPARSPEIEASYTTSWQRYAVNNTGLTLQPWRAIRRRSSRSTCFLQPAHKGLRAASSGQSPRQKVQADPGDSARWSRRGPRRLPLARARLCIAARGRQITHMPSWRQGEAAEEVLQRLTSASKTQTGPLALLAPYHCLACSGGPISLSDMLWWPC